MGEASPEQEKAPGCRVFERQRLFLPCMNGFGLCWWHLGRFEEAARIFDCLLWLNPSDNPGVRFLIEEDRAKVTWEK